MGSSKSEKAVSAEALFAVDADQRIVAWNSEAARVFGYNVATALGAHCYQLMSGSDEVGHRFCRADCPVIQAASEGTAPPTVRLQARTREGDRVVVDVSTIVLLSGEGPGSVIHLCRPATEAAPLPSKKPRRAGLTQREQQVLGCLCRGETTEAMAHGLRISETTVRNHVQHLLEKLAAHSRAEVVALAYQDGLYS